MGNLLILVYLLKSRFCMIFIRKEICLKSDFLKKKQISAVEFVQRLFSI